MSDWGGLAQTSEEAPPFLSTYSRYSGLWEAKNALGSAINAASTTWTTANKARYYPMSLPFSYPVNRVFWGNGSTVGGNADFGIYTFDGERLYSTGSTVTAGASLPQYVTPGTPLWLPPGDYYFGFNHSATSNAVWGNTCSFELQALGGVQQQAVGATALPDPAVFAAAATVSVNLCGVTWTTTGF